MGTGTSTSRSTWPYVAAALIWGIPTAITAVWSWQSVSSMEAQTIRFAMRDEYKFTLPSAGIYSVYHEYRSVYNGTVYNTADKLDNIAFDVRAVDSEKHLDLAFSTWTIGYGDDEAHSNRAGTLLFDFEAPTGGDYEISIAKHGRTPPPMFVLAVKPEGHASSIVFIVVVGLCVNLVCLATAAAIAVTTFVKRRRSKRAMMT